MTDRPTAATPVTLHRFLGFGLVGVTLAFVALRYLGIPEMPRPGAITPIVAYALSALGLVLAAVALIVLKPRVPGRPPGQTVGEYWATPAVVAKVMPVWFLLEGAATIAAAGYFFTGAPACAIVAGALIAAYWLCGPKVFAKA